MTYFYFAYRYLLILIQSVVQVDAIENVFHEFLMNSVEV